jgi:hypothetical protein
MSGLNLRMPLATLITRHDYAGEVEPRKVASLASGNMRMDPTRNPKAPRSVKDTDISAALKTNGYNRLKNLLQ